LVERGDERVDVGGRADERLEPLDAASATDASSAALKSRFSRPKNMNQGYWLQAMCGAPRGFSWPLAA
jgi:hypothetical protein